MPERFPALERFTRRVLMVTRRALGARDCPAKRAATWPRPSRAPGRPPALRARDPALLACLMTELINVWPRFFGALDRTLNCSLSSLRRRLMGNLQRTPAI